MPKMAGKRWDDDPIFLRRGLGSRINFYSHSLRAVKNVDWNMNCSQEIGAFRAATYAFRDISGCFGASARASAAGAIETRRLQIHL